MLISEIQAREVAHALGRALAEKTVELDRAYAAKRETAGAHAVERSKRQRIQHLIESNDWQYYSRVELLRLVNEVLEICNP